MKRVFTILALIPLLSFGQWNQIGIDIDGQAANQQSGTSIKLNASGTVIIVSAPMALDAGIMKGKVRVFERNGTSWIQKGLDIVGTNQGDVFGDAVSISDDGNTIAVGAPGFLNPIAHLGYTQVFEWNGSDWIQKGTDILGEFNNDDAGTAISLSANGNTIAIGASSNNGINGGTSGHCRVYEWNGTSWLQKGVDIDGEAASDFSGGNVSINSAGTIVAVGANGNDGNGTNTGHVRVFEWIGSNWIQKGIDIDGDINVSSIGRSISLDSNGTTFITSGSSISNGSIGSVKIFTWNGTSWVQKGLTLNGVNGGNSFGTSVDINEDGSMIIAGSLTNYAKVFKFIGGVWTQQGPDFIGEANNDQFGRSSSISNNGSIVAIGTPFNDGNGTNAGHVRVFENTALSISDFKSNSFSIYPNPATELIQVKSKHTINSYKIISLDGGVVEQKEISNLGEFSIDVSNLVPSTYMLILQTQSGLSYLRIIK